MDVRDATVLVLTCVKQGRCTVMSERASASKTRARVTEGYSLEDKSLWLALVDVKCSPTIFKLELHHCLCQRAQSKHEAVTIRGSRAPLLFRYDYADHNEMLYFVF